MSELLVAWGPHRSKEKPHGERERTEANAADMPTPACGSRAGRLVTPVFPSEFYSL